MKEKEKLMEDIWVTYHPKLQVYLKQLFPLIIDVEDRVSEILLKVFDNLDKYNPKYALSTWIYRVARNSQIDEIRKVNIHSIELNDDSVTDYETPETIFFKDQDQSRIKECIEKLETYERELIFLYYYEELNYRQISEITGVPSGTLKYRMSSSRKKIENMIKGRRKYEEQY